MAVLGHWDVVRSIEQQSQMNCLPPEERRLLSAALRSKSENRGRGRLSGYSQRGAGKYNYGNFSGVPAAYDHSQFGQGGPVPIILAGGESFYSAPAGYGSVRGGNRGQSSYFGSSRRAGGPRMTFST